MCLCFSVSLYNRARKVVWRIVRAESEITKKSCTTKSFAPEKKGVPVCRVSIFLRKSCSSRFARECLENHSLKLCEKVKLVVCLMSSLFVVKKY